LFLKPNFSDIKYHIQTIYKINKSFGFQVYIGSLASLASAQFGILTIAFFVDNMNVGYFSLAMTITAPLLMVPNVVGTTFFKTFSKIKAIPKNIIIVTLALTFICLNVYLFIAKWIVLFLYTEDYLPTVFLSYILAIGFSIHGIGDFTNRFLYAHGQGNYLRNSSLVVGIVNIAGYVLFVRFFGIKGAAITQLSGSSIYCALMVFYYKKYIN
jgi:O-antigen/teichoic acid export membrane protein